MKIPKLVISDVDGTLFDRQDTITEGLVQLKDMIQRYRIPFTLASGRCYMNLEGLIDYLEVKLPVVVNNGAAIMDKDTLFWSAVIDPEDIKEAVDYADRCGMLISISEARQERVYRHNTYVQSNIDRFQKEYKYFIQDGEKTGNDWSSLTIQKIMIIDGQKPGRVEEVIRRIRSKNRSLTIVRYDDRSIDVMPGGCGKRTGIEKLAQMLGIKMEDIMAVGDNKNDIDMLTAVGLGAAVQNATQSLKERADYVCSQNSAAGVAEILGRLFHN